MTHVEDERVITDARRQYLKDWKARNPEKVAQYARAARQRHKAKRSEYNKEYAKRNKEAIRVRKSIYAKKYREQNRERLIKYDRAYKSTNRERLMDNDREYKDQNWEEILRRKRMRERRKRELQATRPRPIVCEVCFNPPEMGKSLHWDHDHKTGKFRGWLCGRCNIILGLCKEVAETLEALASYLRGQKSE